MVRYRKLGYVELNVSDLERSQKFYKEIVGLEFVGTRADGAILFRCDDEDHYSLALHQKTPAGFKTVGWMLEDEAQFDILHRRLRERGCAFEELSAEELAIKRIGRATRMVEPFTQAVQEFFVPKAGEKPQPFAISHTKIQRLGHVVFATPQEKEAIAFFRDVLNFRESDSIGEAVTFMRPFPNPFHHGIGIGRDTKRVFHHLNFMVSEIDDIGKAQSRMKKNDVAIVFGPGRHPASTSVFFYFLEPDGMTLEYSFGMEEFSEVDARKARVLPLGPESVDTWGSVRDPRMGATGEIEATKINQPA